MKGNAPHMNKAQAGSLGGKATVNRYGREYMRSIGKRGAQTTWTRYGWLPVGTSGYALVHRETNKIVAIVGELPIKHTPTPS